MTKNIGLIFALNAILLLPIVAANPLITAVMYDPQGADTGFEWIELFNPTNVSIQLSNYSLYKGNGAVVGDWSRLPALSGVISPQSFFLIGESNITQADLKLTLGLFNGPDSLKLVLDNETIDLLGYGNLSLAEYYFGSPTIDVVSGKSLVRRFEKVGQTFVFSQSLDNAVDWAMGDSLPRNSLYGINEPVEQNVSVTLIVPSGNTQINVNELSDDILGKIGHQWSLIHGQTIDITLQNDGGISENVTYSATISRDIVSFDVSLQQSVVSKTPTELREELFLTLPVGLIPGNYSLRLVAQINDDSKIQTINVNTDIEVLASVGLTTCEHMIFVRVNSSLYDATCLVTNVGNVAAKMNASLSFETEFEFFSYVVDDNLLTDLNESLVELSPAESLELHLQAKIPGFLRAGSYEGSLMVNAWAD